MLGVALNHRPEGLTGERLPGASQENIVAAALLQQQRANGVEIALELRERLSPEGDEAFLIPLALHSDESRFPIDLGDC